MRFKTAHYLPSCLPLAKADRESIDNEKLDQQRQHLLLLHFIQSGKPSHAENGQHQTSHEVDAQNGHGI